MAKTKSRPLTDADVAAFRFTPGEPPFKWDKGTGAVSGFGVRVNPSGGKQYVFKYRMIPGGPTKTRTLGPVDNFARTDDARREARALDERRRQKGIDPALGRDGSMQAVWDYYIEGLRTGRGRKKAKKGKPASLRTIEVYEQQWKTHLAPVVGRLAPGALTAVVVEQLHNKLSEQRTVATSGRGGRVRGGLVVANNAVAALKAAWRASAHTGLTRDLADPFVGFERNATAVRKVTLKRGDLTAFLAAVDHEAPHLRAYWRLMLLTGARGGELRSLQWDDVDLRHKVIIFRNVKNGEATHEVPLSDEAGVILQGLKRIDGERVFAVADRPRKSWLRILERAGISGLRPHDLRRSVGSWLGAAGLSSKAVGALLGHKSDITSRVYIQLAADEETKRAAANLQAQLLGQFSAAQVVNLDDARERRKSGAA